MEILEVIWDLEWIPGLILVYPSGTCLEKQRSETEGVRHGTFADAYPPRKNLIFLEKCRKGVPKSSINRFWARKSTPEAPKSTSEAPKSTPVRPGGPKSELCCSQNTKTQSPSPILMVFGVTLGPRNGPKIEKKPFFSSLFSDAFFDSKKL